MKEAINKSFWKVYIPLALMLLFTALTIASYRRKDYGNALANGVIAGIEFGFFFFGFMYEVQLYWYRKLVHLQHHTIHEMYHYIMYLNGFEKPRKGKKNGGNESGRPEGSFYKQTKVRK
jgi:hypothetical protein